MGKKKSKKQEDEDFDELVQPAAGGGFFGAVLGLFGMGGAPAEPPKSEKKKKQPKQEAAPALAPAFVAPPLEESEPSQKKKKKKTKKKAVAAPAPAPAAVVDEAGWDTATTKKDKKAKKAAAAAPTPEPQEELWEEAAPKKRKGGAKSDTKPAPAPASAAVAGKKTKAVRYPGAPAFKHVELNKKQTKLKKRLITFFETHNPDKVKEFETGSNDDLVAHYSNSKNIDGMKMLNEALQEKYGADLDSLN